MLHATVIDLNPWVDYEFRVVAINSMGVGEPSSPSKLIRTKAAGTVQDTPALPYPVLVYIIKIQEESECDNCI